MTRLAPTKLIAGAALALIALLSCSGSLGTFRSSVSELAFTWTVEFEGYAESVELVGGRDWPWSTMATLVPLGSSQQRWATTLELEPGLYSYAIRSTQGNQTRWTLDENAQGLLPSPVSGYGSTLLVTSEGRLIFPRLPQPEWATLYESERLSLSGDLRHDAVYIDQVLETLSEPLPASIPPLNERLTVVLHRPERMAMLPLVGNATLWPDAAGQLKPMIQLTTPFWELSEPSLNLWRSVLRNERIKAALLQSWFGQNAAAFPETMTSAQRWWAEGLSALWDDTPGEQDESVLGVSVHAYAASTLAGDRWLGLNQLMEMPEDTYLGLKGFLADAVAPMASFIAFLATTHGEASVSKVTQNLATLPWDSALAEAGLPSGADLEAAWRESIRQELPHNLMVGSAYPFGLRLVTLAEAAILTGVDADLTPNDLLIGDEILSINGFDARDPYSILLAWAASDSASGVQVETGDQKTHTWSWTDPRSAQDPGR